MFTKYWHENKIKTFSVNKMFSLPCSYDLEVNTETTMYMLLSRHQNVGQNHDIKVLNRCLENMPQFEYLGTTVTNQNLTQKEIKAILNSDNAYYHTM
jgi:hypothetical protein